MLCCPSFGGLKLLVLHHPGGPSHQLGAAHERQLVLLHHGVTWVNRDAQAYGAMASCHFARMGRPGANLTPERLNRDAWQQPLRLRVWSGLGYDHHESFGVPWLFASS